MATLPNRPSRDLLATLVTLTPAEGTTAYAHLRRAVVHAGILTRAYRYYAILTAVLLAGLAGSLLQVVRVQGTVSLVVWSLVFSFFAAQLSGLIHDAGHRAIFDSAVGNTIIGEVCCAFLAMGFRWWRVEHNAHHAHTNEEDADPDLAIPLHAFTSQRFQQQAGIWCALRRYQVVLFYPLRVLVVFSRRLASVAYFRTQPWSVRLAGEIALWSIGMGCWFVAPFLFFPPTKAVLLFVVVHLSMGLYLSNIFAPNHKGMPQFPKGTKVSFLERQVRTSRNIAPSWMTDIIYMGLNYQIEHHLFPTCPRNKLKHITPYVVAMCRELNLEYTEVGIIESHRIIVAALNRIARPAG